MVLERAREEGFYDFGPTLTSEHLGRTPDIGELNPHTLRRWMIEARLWTHKKRVVSGTDVDASAGRLSGSWCRWIPRCMPDSRTEVTRRCARGHDR